MKRLARQILTNSILVFLCTYLTFFPAWISAKPIHKSLVPPSANMLPVLLPGQAQSGWNITPGSANNYLEVHQTDQKVVIKWKSFDIGSSAHTHFDQGVDGIALNRIYSSDPSQIFGKLTATGSIYLVNQNGILFGKSSRVNMNSLVASSLIIKDDDFQNGLWKYKAEGYTPGNVVNKGKIESDTGGRIYLLGSNVMNSGTILSEEGYVILSGGSEFGMGYKEGTTGGLSKTLTADYSGEAINSKSGEILADAGEVGIYGKIVRNNGLIRSLSTVKKGSSIELIASEKVVTSKGSWVNSTVKEINEEVLTTSPFPGRAMKIGKPDDTDQKIWDPILVEHYGTIDFPSGNLDIDAGDGGRIYLGPGSLIDVSGSWVRKSALDQVLSAQENSLELRDEFLQKNSILTGKTIYFLLRKGISIGNISKQLDSRVLSVLEESMEGGTISLKAGSGDIIVDRGAGIDISGGGISYEKGYVQTTKLLASDGRIYDIADAPDWLTYVDVINYNENKSESQKTYLPGHTEGANAGSLTLIAKKIAYEGNLSAFAVQGLFQVDIDEVIDDLGYKKTVGTIIPSGGQFNVGFRPGDEAYRYSDRVIQAIVIKDATPFLSADFDPETSLFPEDRNGETWFSDDLLSGSGLGEIMLSATTSIVTEADTDISLVPGGSFEAFARKILHQGDIQVPSGTVILEIKMNKTSDEFFGDPGDDVKNPDYISPEEFGAERIELVRGSRISTAGEKINNYTDYSGRTSGFQLKGGEITIATDKVLQSEGVIIQKGADLDVSGGYLIGTDRKLVDAADAGSLEISGAAIVLDGTIKGHSMAGKNGGSITLYANALDVVTGNAPELEGYSTEDALPEDMKNRLVLDDNRFDASGISRISLFSLTDLVVNENVSLTPSKIKLTMTGKGEIVRRSMPLEDVGDSLISLSAGQARSKSKLNGDVNAIVRIGSNARLTVAPGGEINVTGQGADISGIFNAPAGTIAINTRAEYDTLPLLIREDARFYARGINRDTDDNIYEQIVWSPESGGEVSFSSAGTLIMEKGSLVDVSGSAPVTLYRAGQGRSLISYQAASEPGSIMLSFKNSTDENGVSHLNGRLIGEKSLDHLNGASLSLTCINSTSSFIITPEMLVGIEDEFDLLNIVATGGLDFKGSQTISMARGINIDAPVVTGTLNDTITLNSSWVQLSNTYVPNTSDGTSGGAEFVVNGDFIDIDGAIRVDGFSEVSLNARQDIRLTDRHYNKNNFNGWAGEFKVAGDLKLTASRIYPTTASEFTLKSDGKITILPSGVTRTDPIYSALGKLILEAENIEHRGFLAAPTGQIIFNADMETGRVYLADNSVTTVAGDIAVNYGEVDETNLKWYGYDKSAKKSSADTRIEALPEKLIEINAFEVIGRDESTIDIEGGGSVYGYTFLPGIEGSLDPLSKPNRFVILPNAMGNLPGEAVYFQGNDFISEGLYTLLPESYAFIEGAKVIELQGSFNPAVSAGRSNEGHATVVGFSADAGTGRYSSQARLYTIRDASEVLSEGSYQINSINAGNAGSLKINAVTNILNSWISANAVSEKYRAGIITLSGKDVILSSTRADLGNDFNFNTRLDENSNLETLIGKLFLDARKISESGLWELNIGSEDITESITFEEGSQLTGTRINFVAANDITLGRGAGIAGTGETGSVYLHSSEGKVIMEEGSSITSSYLIGIDAKGIERDGEIKADKVIELFSDHLIFADTANENSISDGFVVDEALWQNFDTLDEIRLLGREKIGFAGDVDLHAQSRIIADTPLLAGIFDNSGSISFQADEVMLLNSQADKQGDDVYAGKTNMFTVQAHRILIGQGDTRFSGFKNINLNSTNNLTFIGKGSFSTSGADLQMTSSKVTGHYRWHLEDGNEDYTYEAVDFLVDSGTGKLSMMQSGGTKEDNNNIGGGLSFVAKSVDHSGIVDLDSGVIQISATGSDPGDGIYVKEGAIVSARGRRDGENYYDGGIVYYETQKGTIELEEGSLTDVSAGSPLGNAGTIAISIPKGRLDIQGELAGDSQFGKGGTFLMDAGDIDNVPDLVSKLLAGGFDNKIDMRVRTGDVFFTSDIAAHEFRLSLDEGNISIDALIDASSASGGGRVEIYAGKNLDLTSDAEIRAKGLGEADGGEIILGTGSNGFMNLGKALFDVTSINGKGGSIHLRVPRISDNSDVALTMNGILKGASKIRVEGVMIYQDDVITGLDTAALKDDTASFMDTYGDDISERLKLEVSGNMEGFLFVPGMEIQSTGDLSLNSSLDLTSWRFGSQDVAGVLTLRAAGDLMINQDILDHPTNRDNLQMDTAAKTTTINLVAGANLLSADTFAVEQGLGDFSLADEKMIYTEGGNINFVSGNDTRIGKINQSSTDTDYMTYNKMKYNLASYTGNIRGKTGGDLILDGGVIQTATGDISLNIKGDLGLVLYNISNIDHTGSIRTTGQPLTQEETGFPAAWNHQFTYAYNSGGDIKIQTGGDVLIQTAGGISHISLLNPDAWDAEVMGADFSQTPIVPFMTWSANYGGLSAIQGLSTMGGGDLSIDTGGDFFASAGTFNEGDLFISARGNLNGRFLSKDGVADINSMSSIGTMSDGQVVEVFDSQLSLTAQGNITLATICNPTLAGKKIYGRSKWNLTYTQDTSLDMTARTGNVTLTGFPDTDLGINKDNAAILPPNLAISAGKDIILKSNFYLPPAEYGYLKLSAGRDITSVTTSMNIGDFKLFMSDMNPNDVYGDHSDSGTRLSGLLNDLRNPGLHSDTLLHENDYDIALIEAGRDISNIQFSIPKAAILHAGRDIVNINYTGQNLRETDKTHIIAGRDIYFRTNKNQESKIGILISGPGLTLVAAGNSIDLGSSQGIQSLGAITNSALLSGDNDLMVIAGIKELSTVDELNFFFIGDMDFLELVKAYRASGFDSSIFNGDDELMQKVADYINNPGFVEGIDGLRQAGIKYIEARKNGDENLVDQIVADVRKALINPMFEESGDSAGNINLVNSKIFTSGGSGDIFTLAKGEINVGISSIPSPPVLRKSVPVKENSGFYTTAGGAIKMFAGSDINVNESRIMTFAGGDIDIWSDKGDVNAGRGSKAAVASSTTYYVKQPDGTYKVVYEPPAVGSGIRATATSVDEAGDIYITTPEGEIDAGEAGIAGRNVTLAANRVLNAQNIQSTGIAMGFVKPSDSSTGIAGFSGSGGLAETGLMNEESSMLASTRKQLNEELPEGYSFEPKWVDVEVIGFDEDDEDDKENNEAT